MKHVIYNPNEKMYFFSTIGGGRITYIKDIESTVQYKSKKDADDIIEMLHKGYDKLQLKRHNLISIPYDERTI